MDTKSVNPKDLAAITRVPLQLVPSIIVVESSLAYLEGALKYGPYNWREVPVNASTYIAAAGRHTAKWWEGENADRNTRVSHLASAIASLGIIMDAAVAGTLHDDRPIRSKAGSHIDDLEEIVAHLNQLYAK